MCFHPPTKIPFGSWLDIQTMSPCRTETIITNLHSWSMCQQHQHLCWPMLGKQLLTHTHTKTPNPWEVRINKYLHIISCRNVDASETPYSSWLDMNPKNLQPPVKYPVISLVKGQPVSRLGPCGFGCMNMAHDPRSITHIGSMGLVLLIYIYIFFPYFSLYIYYKHQPFMTCR